MLAWCNLHEHWTPAVLYRKSREAAKPTAEQTLDCGCNQQPSKPVNDRISALWKQVQSSPPTLNQVLSHTAHWGWRKAAPGARLRAISLPFYRPSPTRTKTIWLTSGIYGATLPYYSRDVSLCLLLIYRLFPCLIYSHTYLKISCYWHVWPAIPFHSCPVLLCSPAAKLKIRC